MPRQDPKLEKMLAEPVCLKKVADFGYESIFRQRERRKTDQLNSVFLNPAEIYTKNSKESSHRTT
jgi:phosphopantetheine adenylyltransferase